MKLVIKNPLVQEILEAYEKAMSENDKLIEAAGIAPGRTLTQEQYMKIVSKRQAKLSIDDTMKEILSGYMSTFFEAVSDGPKLDVTYDTVKNLSSALSKLFAFQKAKMMPIPQNIRTIGMTLASYLALLAINEHNAKISAIRRKKTADFLMADVIDMLVTIGGKSVSLLEPCSLSINQNSVLMLNNPGLTIEIDRAVAAYKELTNVDLSELGFCNLLMQ